MGYLDQLIQDCLQAQQTKAECIFEFSSFDDLAQHALYIYVIELVGGDIQQTYQDYAAFKALKTHACAKLNQPNHILYVGSSRTGIKNRLKQHLGFGPKRTYALHLSQWFQGEYRITLHQYPLTTSSSILQLLEDDLSHSLAPAFGKLGTNNR